MDPYKPIACDLIDHIEHFATIKMPVAIRFQAADRILDITQVLIKTWENKESAEWLFTNEGHRIRLDRLIKINDIDFNLNACSK